MAQKPEELNQYVRTCIGVFVSLMVLTVVTVAVSYLELPMPAAITLALCIALVKGSLVVMFFMHFISEKSLIYTVMLLTVIFFVSVLILPVMNDTDLATHIIKVIY